MGDACISKTAFWILVGCIWTVGLLGIIISSISINNIETINENVSDEEKKSKAFQIIMLIIFIIILCGASIYAVLLCSADGNPQEAHSLLASPTNVYKRISDKASKTFSPKPKPRRPAPLEMRPFNTHHRSRAQTVSQMF